MATVRPFAYNSGSTISGTDQVGSLAIGVISQDYSLNPGGVKWWMGPNEDLGYVIAHPTVPPTQPTEIPGVTAGVGFWRSTSLTDQSFINLCNVIPPREGQTPFTSTTECNTWLSANGYWSSYPSVITSGLALYLDAGNTSSYPGSGNTWTDTISSIPFTLYNSPTYSSNNGGYISFTPSSSQYGLSTTSLSSLSAWTVETWHYYTGTNNGLSPCIITEKWPNSTGQLNYSLGNNSDTSPLLQVGFFNGAWRNTPTTALTANNWYYLAGTYDGSTVKLYVNNSLTQSVSYTGTAATGGQGIVLMRRWDDPPGGYWGGRLSIVRVYSRGLSASEISQNYNSERSRFSL